MTPQSVWRVPTSDARPWRRSSIDPGPASPVSDTDPLLPDVATQQGAASLCRPLGDLTAKRVRNKHRQLLFMGWRGRWISGWDLR